MDDLAHSERTAQDLVRFYQEGTPVLSSGGHTLRKFGTNCQQLLDLIPNEDLAPEYAFGASEYDEVLTRKTLGVWTSFDRNDDSFGTFQFSVDLPTGEPSRRFILSSYLRVFDPVGFLAPLMVFPKSLLRELCHAKLNWDAKPSPLQQDNWNTWSNGIEIVKSIKPIICLIPKSGYKSLQVHCFCDASSESFAACCYLRVEYEDMVWVNFLRGKSKLSPTQKNMTIPMLELLAACLGVMLTKQAIAALRSKPDISDTVYWSDAKSVLALIANKDKRFKVFVANRLSLIHDFTDPGQWRYCPTDQNPADHATRSILPDKIDKLKTWIEGPSFLTQPEQEWPAVSDISAEDITVCAVSVEKEVEPPHPLEKLINHYSSLDRLKRATAYFSRFGSFLRQRAKDKNLMQSRSKAKEEKTMFGLRSNPMSVSELEQAENDLCRFVQSQSFSAACDYLASPMKHKKDKAVKQQLQSLRALSPFLDDDKILRVGGRLQRSALARASKHQAILPKRHHYTGLVILDRHEKSLRKGYHFVLGQVRLKYWPLRGQSTTRFYLRICMFCRLRRATIAKQLMAPLPKERLVTGSKPFEISGCDLFGPEYVMLEPRRKRKVYGCIFTCFSTRAIHIEVVHSLSADSFLNAFVRFSATRGSPVREVWSDNATNFVAAQKELDPSVADFDENVFISSMAYKGVKWTFIPPRSPHIGGLWEIMVKEVKRLLKAVYQKECYRTLNLEEFETFLKEIEGILNWRPLTSLSDDPEDFACLSPMSILHLGLDTPLPVGKILKSDDYRKTWHTHQRMANDFWKQWVLFYLPLLQKRSKWFHKQDNLKPGDLVLLVDKDLVRNQWSRARVVKVYPDKQGLVRKVEIVMPNKKILTRDIRGLCPLDFEVDSPLV